MFGLYYCLPLITKGDNKCESISLTVFVVVVVVVWDFFRKKEPVRIKSLFLR